MQFKKGEGMSKVKPIKRCLVSVYNKTGIERLIRVLSSRNIEIVSTGSSADMIESYGAKVTRVEDLTGFAECLDGRVKTLHPNVHAGILANLDDQSHKDQLDELNIAPFDMVVVNLYPFADTVRSGASFEDCIEKIDIGGPSMVRGAAKNFNNVAIIVEGDDYDKAAETIENCGGFTYDQRFDFARKAFEHTATYDIAVANWFNEQTAIKHKDQLNNISAKKWVGSSYSLVNSLRYGENPHQKGAIYSDNSQRGIANVPNSLVNAKQISGKEMSYNNYVDADAALQMILAFENSAVAIVKHNNPCGLAISYDSVAHAYQKAFNCDPVSAYGSVVATNSNVTLELAQKIKPVFTEVLIAPSYDADALELLKTKKNMRILQINLDIVNGIKDQKFYQISGGILLQDRDIFQAEGDNPNNWQLVAGNAADENLLNDLKFVWKACRSVKSNAILLANDGATVGIGMGQVNRLDSCGLAIERANTLDGENQRAKNAVAASDAFFPFADGLIKLAKAGVKAVVQPGGSIRDQEVIDAANEYGMTMYLTGSRHFWH